MPEKPYPGEILWKYLNSVYADLEVYEEPENFTKEAVTKECYSGAEILNAEIP